MRQKILNFNKTKTFRAAKSMSNNTEFPFDT